MSYCSPTFERLKPSKKEGFINAFFKEFTLHKYDDASVSNVLKTLKMAKGSFYQYFEDKSALYYYLVALCAEEKQKRQALIIRSDFKDFWDYWQALYELGFEFDKSQPIMSNFLLRLYNSSNSPSLRTYFEAQQKQVILGLVQLIKTEQKAGMFRSDVSAEVMAHHLYIINHGILDQLQLEFKEDFYERMCKGKPLFAGKIGRRYTDLRIENMRLLAAAFNHQN